MKRPRTKQIDTSFNSTEHNPAGAARRRLLQAVGGGIGIATVSRLSASGWTRPVIDSAVLPAHAGMSTATGCPVTISGAATRGSSGDFNLFIEVQGEGLTLAAVTTNNSGTISATTTLPPGGNAYYAVAQIGTGTAQPAMTVEMTLSCCANSDTNTNINTGGLIGIGTALQAIAGDDGQCTFTD